MDVVNVGRLLHRCYSPDIGFVTGLWYGYCQYQYQYFGTGDLRACLWRRGATNKNQRVKMRKASCMFRCCRQDGCRRHLRLGRAAVISRGRAAGTYYFPARGTSGRLNAQLLLPIAPSSACEQAVSRELLLPLTRDTVLAAVPWLRFSAKARH